MEIKELLNEYELDWATFPSAQKKLPFNKLRNKTILVAGGEFFFARSIVYSFLAANDIHKLNMRVILIGENTSQITGALTQALKSRKDVAFTTLEMLAKVKNNVKIDYFIYSGCCNKRLINSPETFINEIDHAKQLFAAAERFKAEHFVMLSDYRSYGEVERGVLASEYEDGHIEISSPAYFEYELMKTLESLCAIYAHKGGYDFTILRTAIALAAFVGFDDSIITDILKSVANSEEYEIKNSKNKYSFVYISDILNSIFAAMLKMRRNTVYNVVGKKSTVSTGMLSAMLYDLYPDACKLSLVYSDTDPCYGVAMNNQKIIYSGCKPKIKLDEALQLCIKSLKEPSVPFGYIDTYQGKLDVIHNILLAYLLQVDQICKKYNIKYFLAGGTLLGAVRHNGFIPWDDDADVMMLREDYDKFLKVVQRELPPNVVLHTPQTDSQNHCVFTKLRINNTLFATKWTSKHLNVHNGIFFDVLCHDKTAKSPLSRKFHLQLTILARSLVFNKWYDRRVDNGHRVQSAIVTVMKNILPMRFLEWFQNKCLTHYKNKDTDYLYDGMGRNVYKGDFPKYYLDNVIEWDFEGYKFPIPKEYDKYLTYLYGNYNEMVPASARQTSHSILVMDLGEYAHFKNFPKEDENA